MSLFSKRKEICKGGKITQDKGTWGESGPPTTYIVRHTDKNRSNPQRKGGKTNKIKRKEGGGRGIEK